MKTLIFSDTHLTKRFDPKQYSALAEIISNADKVIINGDFWDHHFTTFADFINSEWRGLFPLLKTRQAIYLFGNHDPRILCNQNVSLFSAQQGLQTKLEVGRWKVIVEHGQAITGSRNIIERLPHRLITFLAWLALSSDMLTIKLFGYKAGVRNYFRNLVMKRWADSHLAANQLLICGHSHYPEFNLKHHFINSGFIQFGNINYVLINNDDIQLINKKY